MIGAPIDQILTGSLECADAIRDILFMEHNACLTKLMVVILKQIVQWELSSIVNKRNVFLALMDVSTVSTATRA